MRRYAFQRRDRIGNKRWIIPTFPELHPNYAIPWFIPFCFNSNEPDRMKIIDQVFHSTSDEDESNIKLYSSSDLEDNKKWVPLDINKEEYVKSLDKLDPVTRAQLLDGDWNINVKGRMFDRSWFLVLDAGPADAYRVRFWDLAATEPSKKNEDPDFTAGVRMAVTTTGLYFIEDVQHFRKSPLQTKQHIKRVAKQDGKAVDIWIEQEPGSSGKIVIDDYVRLLAGHTVHGQPSSGSKRQRAMPFASQAEEGNVYIINGEWNKNYLDELEVFPDGEHDDQVDGSSGSFSKLTAEQNVRMRWA